MLQEIRERAQGWVAWFIVILISIPFALWGISSYLGGGSEPTLATVNGLEITEREFENRYRLYRQRLREQLGASYRPELIDESTLRKEVLDSMVENQLILQQASNMGLGAGDDLVRAFIRSVPAFSIGGKFSNDAYERGLRAQGMSAAGFEAEVRMSLIAEQLAKGINGSEISTAAELRDLVRLRMQRRGLSYMVVPASNYLDDISVSDADVSAYYEENQQRFMAEERVKLEYLELDIGKISETLQADEETLLGYYEQRKGDYRVPEQRRASHILISVDESATAEEESKALERAQQALNRLRAGEDFSLVAREVSEDPGSSEQGGDLDFFDRGVMDPVFEKAAFSLNPGEISDPVRTQFGYHIIKLAEIRAESGKPYEEVEDEVRSAYLKEEAERQFYEFAERLNDLAYDDPNSLQPAADALGLEVSSSDWLTRAGESEGVFAARKVIDAAFSADVMLEGNNSEAIEVGPERMVVVRVTEHEEATVRALDEVKPDIVELLKTERAATRAREKGDASLARLREGESLESIAQEEGFKLERVEGVTRDNQEIPAPILTSLFKLPHPQNEEPSFGTAELPSGDFVVIALDRVEDGALTEIDKLGGDTALKSLLQESRARSYFRHMVDGIKSQAKITISPRQDDTYQ